MRITLIGPPAITADDGARPVRGFQPWAVLVRVLLADRPPTRRELAAELFPDAVDPLGAVRWCLASLRKAVGDADAFTGDPVTANLPAHVSVDLLDLMAGDFDPADAAELLEGVEPRSSSQFDLWLLVQRQRVAALLDAEIRQQAMSAAAAGDTARALELAELGARRQPLDEGAQIVLVASLRDAGHVDAAQTTVDEVEARFRDALGVDPSPALRSAARRHVAAPPPGIEARVRATSLLAAGKAAIAAGAVESGLESLRHAIRAAEESTDVRLLATGLTELGTALVHSVRSHDDEGALLLERAALLAEEVGDHVTAAGAHRELGYVDALAGRRPAADVHLDDAERLADGDPGLLAGAVSVRAFNWCDWGRVPEGIAEYERALDLARSAGNQRRLAWSLGLGGWARLRAGDEAGAEAWLEECLQVVDALRWVAFQPWPVAALCELSLRRGDDPRDRMHEAFSLSCQLADPCWEGVSARALALESAERGRPDDALAWIADARARSLRETDTYVGLLGEILSTDITLSGRFDDAERAASSGRALLELAARAHLDGLIEVALAAVGTSPGGLSSSRYAREDGQALDRDRPG